MQKARKESFWLLTLGQSLYVLLRGQMEDFRLNEQGQCCVWGLVLFIYFMDEFSIFGKQGWASFYSISGSHLARCDLVARAKHANYIIMHRNNKLIMLGEAIVMHVMADTCPYNPFISDTTYLYWGHRDSWSLHRFLGPRYVRLMYNLLLNNNQVLEF